MTATEELRALLDERGVEWRERKWGAKHSVTIFWRARGVRWHYRENQYGEVRLHADGLSPAQAVEATLGRGECQINERHSDWYCTGCGETVGTCDPDSELFVSGNFVELWDFCPYCGRQVKR